MAAKKRSDFDHAPLERNLPLQQIGVRLGKVRRAAEHRHLKPVFFQQLRKHDGGGFINRTAARNAEHRRIGLPLGRKIDNDTPCIPGERASAVANSRGALARDGPGGFEVIRAKRR